MYMDLFCVSPLFVVVMYGGHRSLLWMRCLPSFSAYCSWIGRCPLIVRAKKIGVGHWLRKNQGTRKSTLVLAGGRGLLFLVSRYTLDTNYSICCRATTVSLFIRYGYFSLGLSRKQTTKNCDGF